jgi:peptide/nickel transport system substrate-binding protein
VKRDKGRKEYLQVLKQKLLGGYKMKRKLLLGLLIIVLVALPMYAACGEKTTTPPPTTPTVKPTTPTTAAPANWWGKFGEPKYGGKLVMRVDDFSTLVFDPYDHPVFSGQWLLWYETLFSTDWTLDRSIWPFNTVVTPQKYAVGCLADTWEQPDAKTVIVHLRKGVMFQNKPPVNGRELTADDVVQHYNRLCGIGSGFTMPSFFWTYFSDLVESVTATDKYTVEFKFKQANLINFFRLMDTFQYNYIEAPEWVAQGDLGNWKNAVGTGPFILKNYIQGSALYFSKNPNYWGYDERYPKNKLPYLDEVTVVCIPDNATALAALLSGRIDFLSSVSWQNAQSVKKTNPELEQVEMPAAGCDVLFNLNKSPFTDIKVREALQLSLDLKAIAKAHYGGIVDGTPCGQINPALGEYCFAYKDWPQQLKDEYSYNLQEAKALLGEAGYPNGFPTNIVVSTTSDKELLQIIQSEFKDVGVDMAIKEYDMATYTNIQMTARHDQMTWSEMECGSTNWPFQSLLSMTSYFTNPSTVKDPVYDDMCRSLETITDPVAFAQKIREADQYELEHHWKVRLFPIFTYNIWQPYLKGYSGEMVGGMGGNMAYFARWWKTQ